MFIYKITNLVNGKIYIGQTTRNPHKRFLEHIRYKGNNGIISKAIRYYNKNNFMFEILEEVGSIEELNFLEVYYIKQENSLAPNGYNLESGGDSKIISQITKTKMSIAAKKCKTNKFGFGKPSPNKPGKNSNWYGKTHSLKTKQKMSISAIKRKILCLNNNTEYASIKSAAIALKLYSSNINKVLNGKRKHTKNYIFKYLEG